jgi:protocatechuate 3,4-dioxygenase beta subunit
VASAGGDTLRQATVSKVPACVVRPELTVGPYFVDKQLERSELRVEPTTGAFREGVPLALIFNVSRVASGQCSPLEGAMVDVWHCDAAGVYSGVSDRQIGFDTVGQKFLRGYQVTDGRGVAAFTTIYPGWYQGRTVHIHFKIRTPASAVLTAGTGDVYELTSQLFFDESLSDRVYAQAPYSAKGQRDTTNANDGIFREAGSQLMLAVAPMSGGYTATFDVGLDLSDVEAGKADRDRGPGGPGGRGGRPPRSPGGPPPGQAPPSSVTR